MKSIVLLLLVIFCSFAHSYGHDGHQIIGQVTWNLFSDKMKHSVLTPLMKNMTMQDISVWADQVKHSRKYSFTRSWHYYDSPKSQPPEYCQFLLPPPKEDSVNLVNVLKELEKNLTSSATSMWDKQFAFRMMVHMIQDAAQPLHLIHVPGLHTPIKNQRGIKTNLHAYWDVDTVDQLVRGGRTGFIEQLTHDALADDNQTHCDYDDLLQWMSRTEKVNCETVWRDIDSKDYHDRASSAVLRLLKEAAIYSKCYFTTILTRDLEYDNSLGLVSQL